MDDKTTKIQNSVPGATTAAAQSLAASPDTKHPEKKKRGFISKGEHIHRWTTYLTVDWLFNAFTGVSFAYGGKFSDLGKKIWSGPITGAFEKGAELFTKNKNIIKISGEKGNMFMSIIAGGMFTIPPLMVLEHRKIKKPITHFLNEIIYGEEKVANDPKFQKARDEMDHQPKKDFGSGMWARLWALAPLLAIILIPPTRKVTDKNWFNPIAKGTKALANKIGFSEASFKKLSPAAAKERWDFIHNSAAMDLGLGIPYAILHSVFYNMFASRKARKNQDKITPQPPIDTKTADAAPEAVKPVAEQNTPLAASHAGRETLHKNFVDRAAAADTATGQDFGAAR
jgi:hypothetical protein